MRIIRRTLWLKKLIKSYSDKVRVDSGVVVLRVLL